MEIPRFCRNSGLCHCDTKKEDRIPHFPRISKSTFACRATLSAPRAYFNLQRSAHSVKRRDTAHFASLRLRVDTEKKSSRARKDTEMLIVFGNVGSENYSRAAFTVLFFFYRPDDDRVLSPNQPAFTAGKASLRPWSSGPGKGKIPRWMDSPLLQVKCSPLAGAETVKNENPTKKKKHCQTLVPGGRGNPTAPANSTGCVEPVQLSRRRDNRAQMSANRSRRCR